MTEPDTATVRSADASTTRRRIMQSLGGAGMAALLAGCVSTSGGGDGGDGSDGGDGGTVSNTEVDKTKTVTEIQNASLELSGWAADNTESKLVQQLVDEFERDNPNISVEYNAIQSKYKQKLKTQLGAGNAPDVFYVNGSYYPSFADAGVLMNLSEYIQGDDSFSTDDFFEPLLDAFRVDGTLYGIPKDFSTLGLFHNTAMFESAGAEVPENWDGLRSTLETLQQNGSGDAPMIEFANCRMFWPFLFQNGGSVLNDAGDQCTIGQDANVEALEYIVDLKKDGLIKTPSELGVGWHGAALGKETVAAAILGPWGLPFLEQNHKQVDENIDIAHLPYPSDGERRTMAYTVSYSASKATSSPAAAYRLITGLTSDEGMKSWAEKGLALSARKSHADTEYYQNHPRRKTLLEAGEWSKVMTYGPNSAAILNRIRPQLEAAMLGEKSPANALETAQSKVNREVF